MFGQLFSFTELLSLLGLIQSVYVLVYMMFRSGNWKYAVLPMAYFITLGTAFLLDAAATRWQWRFEYYELYQWMFWFSGVPLGTLLIFQIAKTPDLPPFRYVALLILIPLSLSPHFLDRDSSNLMYASGLIAGAISLLAVWLRRDILGSGVGASPNLAGERFWLILALIVTHAAFLTSTFAYLNEWLNYQDWMLVRNALGLGFVYIAATSLFRIYPQAIKFVRKPVLNLSDDDGAVVKRLQDLFEKEKVYQEPELGRAQLARELGVGEATLSRIVNAHYGKTIPQILNDYRVQDAQRLLKETDVPINSIFAESGFSSMTTFNRVFRELTGLSPKEFRGAGKA